MKMFKASQVIAVAFGVLAVGTACIGPTRADPLPELTVSTFPSPTTSYWFSVLIHKLGLDKKHGFILTVQQKPSQAAYADFVSGASKVCYCIATAAAARFVERGADISQVWINQTNPSIILTADPAIKSAKDLEGKSLAADTATGNWAVAAALISRAGADLSKIKIQPGSISNSVIELTRGRVDAAVANPLDIVRLNFEEPGKYRDIRLGEDKSVIELTGGQGVPYWGLGAWNEWIRVPENNALLLKLYAASVELVDLIKNDSDRIAGEIAEITKLEKRATLGEIKQFWNYNLAPASAYEKAIRVLGSDFLPQGKQLDAPLNDKQYQVLISDFKP